MTDVKAEVTDEYWNRFVALAEQVPATSETVLAMKDLVNETGLAILDSPEMSKWIKVNREIIVETLR